MRNFFFRRRFVFMPFIAAAFLALVGFAVMQLWNGLLPDLFHLPLITFWQGLGLFVLSKLLFGFGGRGGRFGGGPWMRGRMQDRFMNMSEEEREAFRSRMQQHRCWRGPKDAPKETQPAS